MNGSVNKVILIGNLGRDPEIRKLDNGATLASFSIATSESYTDKQSGKKIENTDWHDIVLWRGLAEVAEKFLKKGTKVYIEGRLKKRSWQDREGNTRYNVEVIGDEMTILSRSDAQEKPKSPYTVESQTENSKIENLESDPNDSLPF
ncbi:MAG: single-stranded DNA-binding protein [Flavobacteriales bacterium]|jgi:single-strand DNA-binding protein|nr:single-stranded DNA-binding protein [Flavobacteriales bacterium]MBT5933165.1 single-stranded DNA-binding protein [Flavobacteriales bacterium]MDA7761940.1 single-stranded DNA-binding protein [Crocinitomicaceae bacterium]